MLVLSTKPCDCQYHNKGEREKGMDRNNYTLIILYKCTITNAAYSHFLAAQQELRKKKSKKMSISTMKNIDKSEGKSSATRHSWKR